MLLELNVKNFGIIEEITWKPGEGLNVITGETGAGKSLVVDAVEALLSGQVSEDDIRHGADEARVEGIFELSRHQAMAPLRELLMESGLEAEDDTLLLTCDFRRQGRTTPRVNRRAVSRSMLRDIGAFLVDIHGQSAHLSLLNKEKHLDFLDAFAHTRDLRCEFGIMAAELSRLESKFQALSRSERAMARQLELLNFQVDEIRRAELCEDEEAALERELTLLTSSEKLKTAAYEIYKIVYGDESLQAASSVVDGLAEALLALRQMAETDLSLQSRLEYLEDTVHGLEELAREMRSYSDNLEYDPQRLEEVQNRLELIRGLKRKYGGSIGEVLNFLAGAEKELEGLTGSGERCQQLEKHIAKMKDDMGAMASKLSGERSRAVRELIAAVKKELADLNMALVEFDVSIVREKSSGGIPFPDGEWYLFDSRGVDDVEFMVSTNPGEPLKPLAKIASTGEISRFMLALKSALTGSDAVPVLIFDEIDIGVGGRSGEIIGRKLWGLSREHQVICVTHLPQIAVFADAHYRVSKHGAGYRTVSGVEALPDDSRLGELAVMMSGPSYRESSIDAANDLIRKAGDWKGSALQGRKTG